MKSTLEFCQMVHQARMLGHAMATVRRLIPLHPPTVVPTLMAIARERQ